MSDRSSSLPNEIRSVSDLLKQVSGSSAGGRRWFRGHSNDRWPLVSGIARNSEHQKNEVAMLTEFKRDAASRTSLSPLGPWEWIALAQHYGLPTRLLDWTEHPLVALYFACSGKEEMSADGRIFELSPEDLNRKHHHGSQSLLMLGQDEELSAYLPDPNNKLKLRPLAVTSMRYFDRVTAQVGTFTVSQGTEDLMDDDTVRHWKIPMAYKANVIAELADLNITASTVYPDLAHLANHIKESYAQ